MKEQSMQRSALRVLALTLCLGAARTSWAAKSLSMNEIIADLGLPEEAAERILRGQMVHDEPEESSERELAVGLAFLVQQPPTEVLKAFLSELDLRSDPKLAASVAIVGPGTPEDFAGLVLQPNGSAEAMRYLSASPGEALNLSPEEIRAFNALASAGGDPKTEVEGRLKRLMLRRYQAYLAKGLLGIAPYARSNGLFDVSEELRRTSEAARVLQKVAPEFQQLLVTYPQGRP
jgi:hypothetical protein